jgi:glycosyltransferase involved in cell wall biosynthesis
MFDVIRGKMKLDGPHALPKVTILTPTKNRPGFLAQCAKYVDAQTYPKGLTEWLVVNGGELDGFVRIDLARATPRIESVGVGMPLGMMRNFGVKLATGDIIVHFDDDDWHAPDRVERQVLPFLVRPQLELVATDDYYIGLFKENPVLGRKSLTWGADHFASGGTFAYRKRAWWMHPFANIVNGEDAYFAGQIRAARGLCVNLRDPDIFVYVRHGQNNVHLPPEGAKGASFDMGRMMLNGSTEENAEVIKGLMGLGDFERTRILAST